MTATPDHRQRQLAIANELYWASMTEFQAYARTLNADLIREAREKVHQRIDGFMDAYLAWAWDDVQEGEGQKIQGRLS